MYKTLILPVGLFLYAMWSLTFREENRLKVFGKRVLREILEHIRKKVKVG
jgi:hypothetical protein